MSSQKEKDIIEQQRRLAMMMGKKPKPPLPTKTRPTSNIKTAGLTLKAANPSKRPQPPTTSFSKKPPPPPPSKIPSKTDNSSSVAPPPGQQKRPTRPGLKRASSNSLSSSAATALAAARAKLSGSNDGSTTSSRASVDSKTIDSAADGLPQLKRKTKAASKSNSLAQLVQNVAAKPLEDGASLSSAAFSSNISPEDFWKNLRDWDFVSDLANQQQWQSSGKAGAEESSLIPAKKPLPDTFISHRHYVAAWAPLCLAETRAQLLSDVLTETAQNSNRRPPLLLVNVETTWKGGSRKRDQGLHTDLMAIDSCNVLIKTKHRGDGGSLQFFTHDVCCLIPVAHKDIVERLLRGGEVKRDNNGDSFKKYAMVGHTEASRKEVNGLIIKVSKRKWAQVGNAEMYLLKIGGNITSLREFTALCAVETIPLKRYLLGQHLEETDIRLAKARRAPRPESQKQELLKKMGGVEALGKGFTEYAQKKFNPSQLTAISASAQGYGDGGFTLIKGPPGTGKTTTLVAILNSLHIRQYNKYYEEVRRIAALQSGNRQAALDVARKSKPRLLVCAPSNAAVDNMILKIMEDGFVDGSGMRYNPSMIRVGVGKSAAVRDVALETKVDQILSENLDVGQLESSIIGFRAELQRISGDIVKCRRRVHAIANASSWPLSKDWEIRVDDSTFDETGRVYFVNHKDHTTTYECPPPAEPGETQFQPRSMPEYRAYMGRVVKLVESYFSIKSNLERSTIVKGSLENGANHFFIRQSLESHVLNSVHMVMTTLGTAGNRVFEGADKFEVVVVDEAAQSVEPATLSALQLGSRHSVLVGDPQQLPATIFNVSGRNTKYDRSLFQRLEEAGQKVHMLNEQYRMHPKISHFPRHIFYGGNLLDGPNVQAPEYGNPLIRLVSSRVPNFQPFTVLDLDSKEDRGGNSLSNSIEAHLAVHLYTSLRNLTLGLSAQSRVAVITPYSQQASLLKRCFGDSLGKNYEKFVEVSTVDAFQGREANIVIFSAVRAAGSHGIGFLSDVRRMNVALTRAKNFLFVIARCQSIVVNPYWNDLVQHARETYAVVKVPIRGGSANKPSFGNPTEWQLETPTRQAPPLPTPSDPRKREQEQKVADPRKRKEEPKPSHPRKREQEPKPSDPRKASDLRGKELAISSDPRKRRRTDTNDCPT